MSSKGPTAQVVTVTRSHSDLNKANQRTVNGGTAPHDISPWQVTPIINDAPSKHPHPLGGAAPPQPPRRLHLTTEL